MLWSINSMNQVWMTIRVKINQNRDANIQFRSRPRSSRTIQSIIQIYCHFPMGAFHRQWSSDLNTIHKWLPPFPPPWLVATTWRTDWSQDLVRTPSGDFLLTFFFFSLFLISCPISFDYENANLNFYGPRWEIFVCRPKLEKQIIICDII